MEKWLSRFAVEGIWVGFLHQHPEFFDTILLWLHDEWCRTRADHLPVNSREQARALELRKAKLRVHLQRSQQLPLSLVAAQDQYGVVGVVSLIYTNKDDVLAHTGWLSNLYVVPAFRRRGVASGLIEQLEQCAQAIALRDLKLLTTQAEDYYRQRGWQVERRVQREGQRFSQLSKTISH